MSKQITDTEALSMICGQCASYNAELQQQGGKGTFRAHEYVDGEQQKFLSITYKHDKRVHVWDATGFGYMTGFHVLRAFWSGMHLQRDYAPLPQREGSG